MTSTPLSEDESFDNQIRLQYDLEKWWVDAAVSRDRERANLLRERGRADQDAGVRALVSKLSEQLAFHIEQKVYGPRTKARSKSVMILEEVLKSIEPFELAYLVLSQATSYLLSSHKGFQTFQTAGWALAEALEQELRLRAMLQIEPDLPNLVSRVLKQSSNSIVHRRRVFVNLFHKRAGGTKIRSPFRDSMAKSEAGASLLELVTSTSMGATLAEAFRQWDSARREHRWCLKPSQQLLDIFYRNLDIEFLSKRTAPFGILTYKPGKRALGTTEMLLTKDVEPVKYNHIGGKRKENLNFIVEDDRGFSLLLKVLTHLEQTPFRINKAMLQFILDNKADLKSMGFLPSSTLNIPGCPVDTEEEFLTEREEEKLAEWKKVAKKAHDKFWKERLNVNQSNRVIELATKLSEYDEFYFRWYADFRGRLYQLNHTLSMQGSGLSKSLLQFASPVPIIPGSSNDNAWCEFVECGLRFMDEFAKAPALELRDRGTDRDYLEQLALSTDARGGVSKKNVLPFIAWQLELSRLLGSWMAPTETRHPIQRDATCSSMQHMSAMSGDSSVLNATNCKPEDGSGPVMDLYRTVVPDMEQLGLDRSQVKQFIMTLTYNSTDFTRKNELQSRFEEEYGVKMPRTEAVRINSTLKDAAVSGLGRIPRLQEFLMEVYNKVIVKDKNQALSVSPVNFVVDSTKYEYAQSRFRLELLNRRIQIGLRNLDKLTKVNGRKTRNSWVANIVHSMDACLLWVMINCIKDLPEESRLDLATIHDCVVTRPGQMSRATKALGYAFKFMYSPDSSGMPLATSRLVKWWHLKEDYPELYAEAKRCFGAVEDHETRFDNMRYFFV